MQEFPVNLQGLATPQELAALKSLNVFSYSTQAYASYSDCLQAMIRAGSTMPPFNSGAVPKMWADATAYSGRWYVFAGPEVSVDELLSDRISCGIYSSTANTFFRQNKSSLPRVPSLQLVYSTHGQELNVPPAGAPIYGQFPVGWLEPDTGGPIDFIESWPNPRIRAKYEGQNPTGEKWRANGFRSDMAAYYKNGVFTMFFITEWGR